MEKESARTLSEMASAAAKKSPRGLVCPSCSGSEWNVYYTRQQRDRIFRRRRCLNCGRLVTTMEFVQ